MARGKKLANVVSSGSEASWFTFGRSTMTWLSKASNDGILRMEASVQMTAEDPWDFVLPTRAYLREAYEAATGEAAPLPLDPSRLFGDE